MKRYGQYSSPRVTLAFKNPAFARVEWQEWQTIARVSARRIKKFERADDRRDSKRRLSIFSVGTIFVAPAIASRWCSRCRASSHPRASSNFGGTVVVVVDFVRRFLLLLLRRVASISERSSRHSYSRCWTLPGASRGRNVSTP